MWSRNRQDTTLIKFFLLFIVNSYVLISADPIKQLNPAKGICDPKSCKLPKCKCPGDSIPGSLKPETVPQIVMLTFDDGINPSNIEHYRKLDSQNLENPDNCPIGLTFFVSDDYNNFEYVEELYKKGHEIASHSKSHKFPIKWWSNASYKDFTDEMAGMRDLLSKKSSIPIEKIKGTRVPFLQLDGDTQYEVLRDNNFVWDSTMVSQRGERPTWPFTLDYPVTPKYCAIEPCPKGSYPGLWVIPLIQWRDTDGQLYSMADENKKPKTKAEMFSFFRENFEAHYNTNRAPFGIFIHANWFEKKEFNFDVLVDFLKYLTKKKDVWIIPVSQALDFVKTPKNVSSVSEIPSWKCRKNSPGICDPKSCKLPKCKCPGDSIPGSLKPETVPQIVMLTFDDGINKENIEHYRKLDSQNLANPNNCSIGLTFFVSDDYNNFEYVEELYKKGHEIASHSKSHKFPIKWWSNASYKDFTDEMAGMRELLSKKSSIPIEKIKGTRVPFLQLDGDTQYEVLRDNNFGWDSTMVSQRRERPTWPFTLDYPVTPKYCTIKPCPKGSYPGLWVIPLIQWRDTDGQLYSMADENKKPKTKAEMFSFFRENFEAHYNTNRAPFGIFIHANWFEKKEFNFDVLVNFLKYLTKKKDVWIIPVSQALDFVKTPKNVSSVSEIPSWKCRKTSSTSALHMRTLTQQICFLLPIIYLGLKDIL